jgi:hypothetical protein
MSYQYDHARHPGRDKDRKNEKMKRRIEAGVMTQILSRLLSHGVLLKVLQLPAGGASSRFDPDGRNANLQGGRSLPHLPPDCFVPEPTADPFSRSRGENLEVLSVRRAVDHEKVCRGEKSSSGWAASAQGIKRLNDDTAQKPSSGNTPLAFSGMHLV